MQIYDRNNNLVPLYQPNLLINGDFQINQRGQSEYQLKGSLQYTIDMWMTINNELKINNGIVSLKGTAEGHFRQILPNALNGVYTVALKVPRVTSGKIDVCFANDKRDKLTITESGVYHYTFKNVVNETTLTLMTNGFDGDIEYVDLFEGDIAYKHVKEDSAIALMRCQRYLVVTTLSAAGCDRFKYGLSNRTYSYAGHITINMAEPPKVIIDTEGAVFENCKDVSATVNGNIGVSLSVTVINTSAYRVYGGRIIISCEPV